VAVVVGVHGIAQQLKGAHVLAAGWLPAMLDGIAHAGGRPPDGPDPLRIAYYGTLFRRAGTMGPDRWPVLTAAELTAEDERDLLYRWWAEAARVDPDVPGPDAATMVRTPRSVQRALLALSRSRCFAGVAEHVIAGFVRQVHAYFTDPDVRRAARAAVEEAVGPDTRVIVGHSLGSVVAYETLAAHPEWKVTTLVTLGSPLGIPAVVFDRLDPAPSGATGAWPGPVRTWVNVCDSGDVVALEKRLASRFGDAVTDRLVHNGGKAHDAVPYLTARETGSAIADGLWG
jgi:hypothetical protein